MAREKLFNMRMSAEEWERLEFLSQHYSLNAAGIIRMLVKERHDQVRREAASGPVPATKPRRK